MVEISLSSSQVQMDSNYLGTTNEVSGTTKGQFAAQEVAVSQEVDPSTKDDECASVFQAEKNTKKAQNKKDKEGNKTKLNAIQKAKENQNIQEQDQRNRRITKNTENLLKSIGQFVSKNLSGTIQERSQKLFAGSEKAYQECFEALKQARTPNEISKAFGRFNDVAEQHNALQIYVQVRERELTELKKLLQNLPSGKDVDTQAKQQDEAALKEQIQELEKALDTIKKAQTDLMAQHGARIEDSYKLAPLLRETTAHYTHDITLPPKALCALILDQILPLKGDNAKTFDCLLQGLNLNLSNGADTDIAHFKQNLKIIESCLTQELQSCPNIAISAAILNMLRNLQKIDTIQLLNAGLISLLAEILYSKDKKADRKNKQNTHSEEEATDNLNENDNNIKKENGNNLDRKASLPKNKNNNPLNTPS